MGQKAGVVVDVGAIRAVAGRFDSIGQTMARVARLPLRFDGACAGRAHSADGSAIRGALDRPAIDLMAWARSADEISAGLRCGADRYTEAEAGVSAGMG